MRTRLIMPLVALASLTLAAFFLHRATSPASRPAKRAVGALNSELSKPSTADEPTRLETYAAVPPGPAIDTNPAQPANDADPRVYVARRVEELQDLGTESDPASLEIIISELTNPNHEIRQAAIEATMQFGSRDAIPALMDAAGRIDDHGQRAQIYKAVEYLKLPTVSEVSLPRGKVGRRPGIGQ